MRKVLKQQKSLLTLTFFGLLMLILALPPVAEAVDLMVKGDAAVKDTFGSNSSVVKWVVLAEVIVGGIMYMMTKNIKFLAGFAILSVFISVGMGIAGY
ncbi:MAG TPA: type IV conjugative transfer system pilin TraA [Arsenophonus nasoniae]